MHRSVHSAIRRLHPRAAGLPWLPPCTNTRLVHTHTSCRAGGNGANKARRPVHVLQSLQSVPRLIKQGPRQRLQAARVTYDAIVDGEKASPQRPAFTEALNKSCLELMKHSFGSAPQRALLDSMLEHGYIPTPQLFNTHLKFLRAEGSDDKIDGVLDMMGRAEVAPNKYTNAVLKYKERDLARQRRTLLKGYQLLGHDGVVVAWQLFERLAEKGTRYLFMLTYVLPLCALLLAVLASRGVCVRARARVCVWCGFLKNARPTHNVQQPPQ